MKIYSYRVEHDYGLAPNPFGKYCTLAVCKPKIRKSRNLEIGDWVIGTGSKALEQIAKRDLQSHLVYAMQITERISLQEYWEDERFQYKKPIINGPLVYMYGDNFYCKNGDSWTQMDSAHSNADGTPNERHLATDTSGENVLISTLFWYFGQNAPKLPSVLIDVCHSGIGEKIVLDEISKKFVKWLAHEYQAGIHGDPINWLIYDKVQK